MGNSTAVFNEFTVSCIAWASGTFELVNPPLHRIGNPTRRAS